MSRDPRANLRKYAVRLCLQWYCNGSGTAMAVGVNISSSLFRGTPSDSSVTVIRVKQGNYDFRVP